MIQLAHGKARATVDPNAGGRLVSLAVGGHDILAGADPEPGDDPSYYSGMFPMAPFVGRLMGPRFSWRGDAYDLESSRPHLDHGTVHDGRWQTDATDQRRASLHSPLGPVWPFSGTATLDYALSDAALDCTLTVVATEPMPVSLGFHPWFRRTVGGHSLRYTIESPTVFSVDEAGSWHPRENEPEHPWDAVLTTPSPTVSLGWGPLELRLTSARATHWIVCETFDSAVCVEPLTALPNSTGDGSEIAEPGHAVLLDLRLEWIT